MSKVMLTASGKSYVGKLMQLGLLEKTERGLAFTAEVKPLLDAIHQVLAGGKAEVRVVRAGVPETAQELGRLLAAAQQETLLATQSAAEDFPVVP